MNADSNGNCGQQVCPQGFWGLGDSCFDLDECGHPDFNECKDGTTCLNHDGGYSCVCPNGVEANSNGDCLGTGYENMLIIYIAVTNIICWTYPFCLITNKETLPDGPNCDSDGNCSNGKMRW